MRRLLPALVVAAALACVWTAPPLPRAAAQPTLLAAVDELTARGECEAALALLDHVAASPAELAGRRGLCEVRLGRTQEAAGHLAIALGDASDPWALAHHAELLAALAAAAQRSDDEFADAGSVRPSVAPAADAAADPAPAPVPRSSESATIDSAFLARFGREPVADVPRPRLPLGMHGQRVTLRGFGGLGASMPFDGGRWRDAYTDARSQWWSDYYYYSGAPTTVSLSLGVEADVALARRVALVTDVGLRLLPGYVPGEFEIETSRDSGNDRSYGRLEYGLACGLDLTATLRFATRARVFVGVGMRYGFLRARAKSILRDVSADLDANDAGDREGTLTAVTGGSTLGATIDLGYQLRGGSTIAWRNTSGVPIWVTELVVAVPFWGGSR